MKIMHLSDLHIGLKLFEHSLAEDQEYIFRQIAGIAGEEQPDVIVIAGDIYNQAVPSAEAVSLFDTFLNELRGNAPESAIMMISGNHDSADRINAFRQVLCAERVWVIGQPPRQPEEYIEKVTLTDEFGPVDFYLLPYVKPAMVRNITGVRDDGSSYSYDEALHLLMGREKIDLSRRNVLVSHQFYLPVGTSADQMERMDSEVLKVGNIDLVRADLLEPFEYAALGHIHKPMRIGSEYARYCGTPLACSVSEGGQEKAVLIAELGAKGSETQVRRIPLCPLRQVRRVRGTLEEVLRKSGDDFIYVELTDPVDLDAADMNARLFDAFPHLLKISRINARQADYSMSDEAAAELVQNPFELCRRFLRLETTDEDEGNSADEEYLLLLKDIINTVLEGNNETG